MAPDDIQLIRDRVLKLEMQVENVQERQKLIADKVDEMHELLTKAKGARWLALILLTVLSAIGGYVANVVMNLFNPPPH